MTAGRLVALWIATLVVFTGIDHFWLKIVARDFYVDGLGPLLRADVLIAPALGVYMVLALGVVVLAVRPALAAGSWSLATRLGALLGFVAYAAYDLTNLATLQGFPIMVAVVDLAWGTAVCGTVATVSYGLGTRLSRPR